MQEISLNSDEKPNNCLQRGTFSTATITKRSTSSRPSFQPILQSNNALPVHSNHSSTNNGSTNHHDRRNSISLSDHSSISSNASNYDSPCNSSININGIYYFFVVLKV